MNVSIRIFSDALDLCKAFSFYFASFFFCSITAFMLEIWICRISCILHLFVLSMCDHLKSIFTNGKCFKCMHLWCKWLNSLCMSNLKWEQIKKTEICIWMMEPRPIPAESTEQLHKFLFYYHQHVMRAKHVKINTHKKSTHLNYNVNGK